MNLLDSSFIQQVIGDIETSQNRERRQEEIKAFEIYCGSLNEHVYNKLKTIYPKTYNSFTVADLNLTKKIIDRLSKGYKQSPQRELDNENETNFYTDFLNDADAKKAFQTFDVYYNLHRHACIWFNYVTKPDGTEMPLLRPLTPFQFSRKVNQYGETELFIVNFPSNDFYETTDTDGRKAIIQDSHQDTTCKRYALWSKDQHVVIRYYENSDSDDCRIVYEEIDGNSEYINPLGVIPAVFAQQGDNAALPILNPLPNQTIEYCHQYSVMLTGNSLQTFGHLVLTHPESQQMPDEIYNSLFTYSRLPQVDSDVPTQLTYLNPAPNLSTSLEVLKDFGSQIISEHLGDGAQTVAENRTFTSGLDRMIAMSDITNIIESNQQGYSKVENDLYLIIKAFFEAKNDFRFRSEKLSVNYSKAKPIQSEEEILRNIEKKIALGLIEKYEALLMLNPNMTSEAAMRKIEKVKQEKMNEVNFFMGDISGDTNN